MWVSRACLTGNDITTVATMPVTPQPSVMSSFDATTQPAVTSSSDMTSQPSTDELLDEYIEYIEQNDIETDGGKVSGI